MKLYEIKRKGKAVGLTALLFLCAGVLAACGENGEEKNAIDLSLMTPQEQMQLKEELEKQLRVDGVQLLTLYNKKSDAFEKDESAWESEEDLWEDGWTESPDEANETAEKKQRYFAVAIEVKPKSAEKNAERAHTVSYTIYDLKRGLPNRTSKAFQKISVKGYQGSEKAPCEIGDVNFDEAEDIFLRLTDEPEDFRGAFFLWNEERGGFQEQEELAQLKSPVIEEEYGIIREHIGLGERQYTDNLYRWEENRLVPVRRIVQRRPNVNSLQGEVYDWYEDYWEPMYERKILVSPKEWTAEDYEKAEDLAGKLADYYDPDYIGW